MDTIVHPKRDKESWNSLVKEVQKGEVLSLTCPLCLPSSLLQYTRDRERGLVDLEYQEGWSPGNLKKMQLRKCSIRTLIMRCADCKKNYSIVPHPFVDGTKLTLRATIFIALMYETGYGSFKRIPWRELAEELSTIDTFNHSTLFKAHQFLGRIMDQKKTIEEMVSIYKDCYPQKKEEDVWPHIEPIIHRIKER